MSDTATPNQAFHSLIQVLKVDPVEEKTGKDGSKYTIRTAQTALLADDGSLEKVGRLRIPERMADQVKVGTFRAGFSLEVAQWGQNKGDVIASLVSLIQQPVRGAAPAAAPAAKP